MKHVLRIGRRIGIAIAGGVVIIAGIILAMPLVPGPGIALILLGLGILSVEFEWPRVWLARIKEKGVELKDILLAWPRVWLVRIREKGARFRDFVLRRKSRSGDEHKPPGE
jgi:hypothetical protein